MRLLRQYEPWECGEDGYPHAWHHSTAYGAYPAGHSLSNPAIKHLIRMQADHRCLRCGHPYWVGEVGGGGEWSTCDHRCSHGGPTRTVDLSDQVGKNFEGGYLKEITQAQWRILTVHHLDEDKANCRWWNLAALCQRCHLRMQRAVVMGRAYHYEHSDWFKPYAAGFYAWKYLGEDLERGETLKRLPELLALEHRFTQEVLW
jgi:5-methylcytosine-specific restriction endonuclease McrA